MSSKVLKEPGGSTASRPETPALIALEESGIDYRVVVHERVSSLEEAAAARGVEPSQVIKTIVIRRGEEDYLFVLVPGDRLISWPKLRKHLGVSRLTMPDRGEAEAVTGYEVGTITPFGATTPLPVIVDQQVTGEVSVGCGAPGVSAMVDATVLADHLQADVADVTQPATG